MPNPRKFAYLVIASAMAFKASAVEPAAHRFQTPVEESGTLGEAPYRIDVPDPWNGELVILARGFEPVGTPRTSPMPANEATSVFLSRGYAVAQSGYSSQGWAVHDAMTDIELLRQHFVRQHGQARRTYLVGFSMGGGIAAASLERHADEYDGALSLCGANVPGARLAQELLTTLVAFDYFFQDTTAISGGLSAPQAATANQGEVMSAISGVLADKPAVASRLASALHVPAEALPGVVSLHYLVFHDMVQRAGGLPVDNRRTVYSGFGDDEAFNAKVRRYAGDPRAMRYVAAAPALTGRTVKPLVIQYNHADPTITPRLQAIFTDLSSATGKAAPLTLPAVGAGHCGFSPEQIAEAFQTLVDWVGRGNRPSTN